MRSGEEREGGVLTSHVHYNESTKLVVREEKKEG